MPFSSSGSLNNTFKTVQSLKLYYMLLSFFDDLSIVILILLVFSIYNILKKGWTPSPTIAMLVTIIITLLILVPYVWFRYVLFAILVLGAGLKAIDFKNWGI